ncbi:MAG: pirin-like C-terminal cupin domain-containing protein, partial [Pseudomonadota bacterium]
AETAASFVIGGDEAEERALYVAFGAAEIDGVTIEAGQMAILKGGEDIPVSVIAGTRFMLAGGQKMDGPRLIDWNFVATDKERLAQAKADWTASAAGGWANTPFTLPEGEDDYIPLPDA